MIKSYDEEMQNPKSKKLKSDAKMRSLAKMTPLIKDTDLSDISESDAAKGLRNYGRMYKQGLGMKPDTEYEYKKGGAVKSSASKRADGCATKGKTKGRFV